MKNFCILSTLFVLLTVLLIPVQARTWTSIYGNTVEGDFVALINDGTEVRIRKSNGKFIKIALGKLSKEDQEFVKKQNNDSATTDKLVTPVMESPKKNEEAFIAGARMVKTVKGVEFAFRWCPAVMMGAPEDEEGRRDNETQHKVTLTKGFWMLETEVTQKQWKAIMGTNPSHFEGDDLPVESVSWNDCQEFCEKCTNLGLPVSLPTEAQWEYACRAGTTGPYAGNLDEMAWYRDNSNWDNSSKKTHPVGTKKANAWGLYDMHGNVEEWCADRYEEDAADPFSYRVFRGGCLVNYARFCRSALRSDAGPKYRRNFLGFRVVLKGQ